MIRGASAAASRAIASAPLPATGWGSRSRGTSGIPLDSAIRSPCGQKWSVTRATTARSLRANSIPSRTVPDVQLPQWP